MNNRALIGLSAAAMSALVATAVGCGEPQQKTYTPAEEPAATVEATTEADTTEEAAESTETEAATEEKAEETTEAKSDEKAAETTEATDEKADADKAETTETADADKADTATAGAYTDGTYTAEGKGIGGKVPVTVTVEGGKIAKVEVGDNSETQGIGSKAIEQLPDAIVEANGTDGVDAVSGASVTSKAIFTAVEDCLEQASA